MLCYRCEWRAQFLEKEHGPRFECCEIESAVSVCYMYKPVAPCVLTKAYKDDPRSEFDAPMIAARSRCVGVAECDWSLEVDGEKYTIWAVKK